MQFRTTTNCWSGCFLFRIAINYLRRDHFAEESSLCPFPSCPLASEQGKRQCTGDEISVLCCSIWTAHFVFTLTDCISIITKRIQMAGLCRGYIWHKTTLLVDIFRSDTHPRKFNTLLNGKTGPASHCRSRASFRSHPGIEVSFETSV